MENQKLFDLDTDLPEHQPTTISSSPIDGILSEDLKDHIENDIDDLILMPEKVINTEKHQPIENTFEVIDQESKVTSVPEEDNEVIDTSQDEEEKEIYLENDPVSFTKTEELEIPLKSEPSKEEEPEKSEKKALASEKPESKNNDNTKVALNQENEPVNVVPPEAKIVDTPEVPVKKDSKKDADEGDVGDIKIGPDELFCRIGLGKIVELILDQVSHSN